MPVHDWTRVDDGTFHAFHSSWNTHIAEALNDGLLPSEYYALSEQVASRRQTDVLTLQTWASAQRGDSGGLAVVEHEPRVRMRLRPSSQKKPQRAAARRRHVTVRHVSGNRVVAVVEVVSPANKDRRDNVRDLAGKVVQMLEADIQVLVIDLLPPGKYDPQGIHGAVWSHFDSAGYQPPEEEPFTLASYRWDGSEPEVFLEPVRLGQALADMPLFLNRERYVNVPLERTYLETYTRFPAYCRHILEGNDQPPTPQ